MNQTFTNKAPILYLGVGLVCGAIAGYLISEVIVDRVVYGKREKDDEDDEIIKNPVDFEFGKENHISYDKLAQTLEKTDLKTLAKKYVTVSDMPTRIIEPVVSGSAYAAKYPITQISYYTDDSVFAFSHSILITLDSEEVVELFGPNIHLHFGDYSDDPDLVWVLNTNEERIYRIKRIYGSYAGMVVGTKTKDEEEIKKVVPKKVKPKVGNVDGRQRRAAQPKPDPRKDLADELDETDGP